jgi:hypothetical protein
MGVAVLTYRQAMYTVDVRGSQPGSLARVRTQKRRDPESRDTRRPRASRSRWEMVVVFHGRIAT